MKKAILLFFLVSWLNIQAQVSINSDGSAPDGSAMLEVKSTSKGLLIPRMTASERSGISSAATGLLVYQTDGIRGFYYFTGTSWQYLPASVSISTIQDVNGDTKVQTEKNPNEDKIRFDAGGTERMTLHHNRLEFNFPNLSTYLGQNAGNSTYTSTENTALGNSALNGTTTGSMNTAAGNNALFSNTSGEANAAFGFNSLHENRLGQGNVAIGSSAGYNALGSNNIFIGNNAGSDETGSNKLYIDNTETGTPLIWGDFSVNKININGQLGVGTTAQNNAAALEVTSTSKGLLPPRMTLAQRNAISSPPDGLMVFCTDCGPWGNLQVYYGSLWNSLSFNRPPYVSSVGQAGSAYILQILTGSYTYHDSDNDPEGPSIYKWYRADNASGLNEVQISGATSLAYTLTLTDVLKYVRFSVTPVAATGGNPGTEVKVGSYIGPVQNCMNDVSAGTGNLVAYAYDHDGNGTATYIWCARQWGTTVAGYNWLDRNLGAYRRATSASDGQGRGSVYQFGRVADGHQRYNRGTNSVDDATSSTTATKCTNNNALNPCGHGNFVAASGDWTTQTASRATWWDGSPKGPADPCPSGWRVPTSSELYSLDNAISPNNFTGAFNTLAMADGTTRWTDGGSSSGGRYWSSTYSADGSAVALYYDDYVSALVVDDGYGGLVNAANYIRCIAE